MHEDRRPMPRQHEVGTAGQVLRLQPEAESEPMHEGAHEELGLRVTATDLGHEARSLGRREAVHQDFGWEADGDASGGSRTRRPSKRWPLPAASEGHRHREAGSTEVLISSGLRWAIVHELRGEPELSLGGAIGRLSPCDLVLVEGYKRLALPKLEIHRSEVGKPWLHPDDPTIVAIASDLPPPAGAGRTRFRLDEYDAIATFVALNAALPPENG